MNKSLKKLALSRETIRPLSGAALHHARGGARVTINTTSIDKTEKQITLTLLVGMTCTTYTVSDLWTCPITPSLGQ